jgi:N-acetylneuraminic acid mutarotase
VRIALSAPPNYQQEAKEVPLYGNIDTKKAKKKVYPLKGSHKELFDKIFPEMIKSGHETNKSDSNKLFYFAFIFYITKKSNRR